MEIRRVDTYEDSRFSESVLRQHGCFLVDGEPYEVEITSESEAVIRGREKDMFPQVIEEFRFYTPHIVRFYDSEGEIVQSFPELQRLKIPLNRIQPSQFYVDQDKIAAVSGYIHRAEDIVIQAMPYEDGFISLDGHTRLYYAVMQGWEFVCAVAQPCGDYIYRFVEEARKRDIRTPGDMALVPHEEYEEKWNRFCDAFFAEEA